MPSTGCTLPKKQVVTQTEYVVRMPPEKHVKPTPDPADQVPYQVIYESLAKQIAAYQAALKSCNMDKQGIFQFYLDAQKEAPK